MDNAEQPVRAVAAGRLAFCGSHDGLPADGSVVGSVPEQVGIALDRLDETLAKLQVDLTAVRQMSVYLIDLEREAEVRALIGDRLSSNVAITVLPVSAIGSERGGKPSVAVDAVAELKVEQNTEIC